MAGWGGRRAQLTGAAGSTPNNKRELETVNGGCIALLLQVSRFESRNRWDQRRQSFLMDESREFVQSDSMSARNDANSIRDARIRRIKAWLTEDQSADPMAQLQSALEVRDDVVEEFALRLTPAMNRLMHAGGFDTFEAKKSAAKAATLLMRGFGLCFKCPRSAEPAALIADTRNNGIGRFQFFSHAPRAVRRRDRTLSAVELPNLELIPEPSESLKDTLKVLHDNFVTQIATEREPEDRGRG
jgi:hypothetical protein